ncbi:CM0216.310.nc protein [Striga asiatica]|uniref:CM0216.310.nc protein n=1 Tax=Striga asiatica TaxID=4170 RepID=A0A5A7QD94_STRAF|nr:CM0216.310.nc protein [Striga asiatica]
MDRQLLEKRPAIFVVGLPNVGKRTLISRLLSMDIEDAPDPSPESLVLGWTINTKYYTADVSVWMAHLSDESTILSSPIVDRPVALVMVFDLTDVSLNRFIPGLQTEKPSFIFVYWNLIQYCRVQLSSLTALKEWVAHTDIHKFDILLCIGNKVDLVPHHPAHMEYKRRLARQGASSIDPLLGLTEYGISETEGSSLLGDEEPNLELTRSCLELCLDHNVEYVETCATSAEFDKCLSVEGDLQGIEKLYRVLSAHIWPGMLLKSGDRINEPSLPDQEELSDEESDDYQPEYEKLSSGSAEPWDSVGWISADGPASTSGNLDRESEVKLIGKENKLSTSVSKFPEEIDCDLVHEAEIRSEVDEEDKTYDFENLEKLMAEIGNMRNGLKLMPDFQRREMAAKLAMKMAAMFGDSSEEDFVNPLNQCTTLIGLDTTSIINNKTDNTPPQLNVFCGLKSYLCTYSETNSMLEAEMSNLRHSLIEPAVIRNLTKNTFRRSASSLPVEWEPQLKSL